MGFATIDDNERHHRELLSKIATNEGHGENSCYFDGWKAYDNDPYHHLHNPTGVIQMGLAENSLCHDLMEEWIKRNPEASICTPEGLSQWKDVALFQDYHGLPEFRSAIARFMEKVRGGRVKFDPDRIVMSGGATGAIELMASCLADPGDAFLVPTPYYPAFDRDLRWRTGVQLLPVHCWSSKRFTITQDALEAAYQNAIEADIRVKGILITNPSNPLGTFMDRKTLQMILSFSNEKNIHLVCDEVYAGTVFDQRTKFTSIAELLEENDTNKWDRGLVHLVYSLSKDLGLPGFRVGIVYSYNDAVVSCGRKMSSFGLVSSQTQHLLARMLSDEDFTSEFIEESRKRLSRRREDFAGGLAGVGIPCLGSGAGLFCWMDLRHLLKEVTEEGETELWRVIVDEVKLNVSPGTSFHCAEPGWFRACFANMEDETMEEALRRIRSFVSRSSGGTAAAAAGEEDSKKKKKRWQAALRLSMPRRFEEMAAITPRLLSPHSPLVKATS